MSTATHSTASDGMAPAVAQATWNGVVLAETTCPVLLEGNTYFPPEDVRHEHLATTRHRSLCARKGLARYYTIRADGQQNTNAAWHYPHPSPLARLASEYLGISISFSAADAQCVFDARNQYQPARTASRRVRKTIRSAAFEPATPRPGE